MTSPARQRLKPDGSPNAPLAVVGEAPARNEMREGRAFVGTTGRLLWEIAASARVTREMCYVLNVLDYNPPKDKFALGDEDLSDHYSRLARDLRPWMGNCIVAVGNEALFALTGKDGITKWRGSILEATLPGLEGRKVVPIVHTSFVQRGEWRYKYVSQADWKRIAEESKSSQSVLPQRKFYLAPPANSALEYIEYLIAKRDPVTFDIETRAGQIACVGIGNTPDEAMCIPFVLRNGDSYYPLEVEVAIWQALQRLFVAVSLIAHNASYEWMYFTRYRMKMPQAPLWDTNHLHHVLYPELPHKLSFVSSIYTREPFYKDMVKDTEKEEVKEWSARMKDDVLWQYNCKDVAVTHESALAPGCLVNELRERHLEGFYDRKYRQMFPLAIHMQQQGILFDTVLRDAERPKMVAEIEKEQAVLVAANGPANVNSPTQVRSYLEARNIAIPIDRKTGRPTTKEEALLQIYSRTLDANVLRIIDQRGRLKYLGTYIDAPLDEDQHLRCSINLAGTESGRPSASINVFGTGTNMLTPPRDGPFRSMLLADPGCSMCIPDLSQAEARVVACYAEDPWLLEVFRSGKDIHRIMALHIIKTFGRRSHEIFTDPLSGPGIEEVLGGKGAEVIHKDSNVRYVAKRTVHANNYDMGPHKFAYITRLSYRDAREVQELYHTLARNVRSIYHKGVQEMLRRSRLLVAASGRPRTFMGMWGDELFREAYAFLPQAPVTDKMTDAMLTAWDALRVDFRLHIYDSAPFIVTNNPEALRRISEVLKPAMESPTRIKGFLGTTYDLVIPADFKVGPSMGKQMPLESWYAEVAGLHR